MSVSSYPATMSAVENLRRFVSERLSAAAQEILGAVEKTFIDYEREMEHQRGLLDIQKSQVQLQRTEQRECRGSVVLPDQHLGTRNQEQICSVSQEDPPPPQVKEEQEELSGGVEGEQFVPKQEDDGDHSDPSCEVLTLVLNEGPSEAEEDFPKTSTAPPEAVREPFTCSFCQKSYAYKSQLVIHMRSHTGEKPFSCSTCGKGFSRQYLLNVHMRSHTGEKPYSCSACGKRFSCDGNLNVHMRIHTGEKPYACCTCGKSFSQKESLRRHMRTHSGDGKQNFNLFRK